MPFVKSSRDCWRACTSRCSCAGRRLRAHMCRPFHNVAHNRCLIDVLERICTAMLVGAGVIIYLLPFPETRKGLSMVLSGEKREAVGIWWQFFCGGLGLYGKNEPFISDLCSFEILFWCLFLLPDLLLAMAQLFAFATSLLHSFNFCLLCWVVVKNLPSATSYVHGSWYVWHEDASCVRVFLHICA